MKKLNKLAVTSLVFAAIAMLFVPGEAIAQRGSSLEWRGTVDHEVRIEIRGRNVRVNTIRGQRYNDGRYNFSGGAWGRRNEQTGRARVQKLDGRGRVRVVQQPNRRNNYTTVIRVDDPKGGPDRYRFRVTWN